ncbi:MAG: tetratricopeptide repeat protein [Chloroflexi bacterium]|nr:tetratricopeptide repeat protein [Chloroflexota bacterium]
MTTTKSIFISSTSLDLKPYREAAIEACHNLGFLPIAMENFEAMGVGATEGSKRKLRDADLYVGIIAHRYGYVEAGYDRSVTEIEFDYAGERGLERLCFLVDPGYTWPEAAYDHDQAASLKAFKAKIEQSVIRSLFTTVEDFQHKLIVALVEWQEWRAARSGELDAILATLPDDVPEQPETLVGRGDLVSEINGLLDKGKRVLLQGFGGTGKTALAAAVAAGRIRAGKGPVLWLRAGTEDRDDLLAALARPFNAEQTLAKEISTSAKARVVRLLLMQNDVRLVVLDDVWNGRSLNQLLNVNAIPGGTPVLVTSRQRYSGLTRVDVGSLTRAAALALLSHYSQPEYVDDPQADALCDKLGDHVFAVRLAGLTMALDELTPGELLKRFEDAPYKLAAPDGMADEGRRSVEDLLTASLYTLDSEARALFLAFGAFFTSSLTPELLALYLEREGESVEDALNRLQRRGLAERSAGTGERAVEYRIHDLAYSYAKAQASDEQRRCALDSCLAYLERHCEPQAGHFAALRSELDNFLGAVNWAMTAERYADVMRFADRLYRDPDGREGFLHLSGYAGVAAALLAQAVNAAQQTGDPRRQAIYLGHLGSAYRDMGQVKTGMKYYRQALKLHRDLNDTAGEGFALGRLGIAYRLLGQGKQAIDHLQQALAIARQVGDERAESINLANLGIAYRQVGQTQQARAYLEQALMTARKRGDVRGEGINLGNLGDTLRDVGRLDEAAVFYRQALKIAQDAGDRRGEGINLGRLGDAYREQRQYMPAIDHLERALAIARETGDKRGEAINLGRLGDTCRDQGQLEAAVAHHEEALDVCRQMDDKRGEGYMLFDLGLDYLALGQPAQAVAYLRAARGIFEALGADHQIRKIDEHLAAIQPQQG